MLVGPESAVTLDKGDKRLILFGEDSHTDEALCSLDLTPKSRVSDDIIELLENDPDLVLFIDSPTIHLERVLSPDQKVFNQAFSSSPLSDLERYIDDRKSSPKGKFVRINPKNFLGHPPAIHIFEFLLYDYINKDQRTGYNTLIDILTIVHNIGMLPWEQPRWVGYEWLERLILTADVPEQDKLVFLKRMGTIRDLAIARHRRFAKWSKDIAALIDRRKRGEDVKSEIETMVELIPEFARGSMTDVASLYAAIRIAEHSGKRNIFYGHTMLMLGVNAILSELGWSISDITLPTAATVEGQGGKSNMPCLAWSRGLKGSFKARPS